MVNYPLLMIVGVGLLLIGLGHFNNKIALTDAHAFRVLHRYLRRFKAVFRLLWHLGRTPFTLIALALSALIDLQIGIYAAIVFFLIATIEWAIKRSLQRPRPFSIIPDATMEQPRRPQDPSFPSGDTMRVWFLALTLSIAFGFNPMIALGIYFVALLVSVGRIALGVHFPLDVVAGAGLGIFGAGITLNLIANYPLAIIH